MRPVNIILLIVIALAALCVASIGAAIACRIATLPITAAAYTIGLTGLFCMALALALAIILAESTALSQRDVVILPTRSANPDKGGNRTRLVVRTAARSVGRTSNAAPSARSDGSRTAPGDDGPDAAMSPAIDAAMEIAFFLTPASAALWIVSLCVRFVYPLAAIPITPQSYGVGMVIAIGAFAAVSVLAFWAQVLFGPKGKIRLASTRSASDALT